MLANPVYEQLMKNAAEGIIVKTVIVPVTLLQVIWAYQNINHLRCALKEKLSAVRQYLSDAQRRVTEEFLTESERQSMLHEALDMKNEGNEEFKNGNFPEAITKYTMALQLCPLAYNTERASFLSNRAATYIKMLCWNLAIQDCTNAIKLGAPNDKPLKRRAIAYSMCSTTLKFALKDYETLAEKYPNQTHYKENIRILKKKIADKQEIQESYERMQNTLNQRYVSQTLKLLNDGAEYAGAVCGYAIRRLFP